MFKRLRERIAEEATKFPVGQLGNNTGKPFPEPENKSTQNNSTEDLITLSDSSSVVVPHTSPQQFSIGEEEDGSLSEQSTPQKNKNASSVSSGPQYSSGSINFADLSFGQEYRPSKKISYVPQSDIESEREDPPTLNLDGISKDQLMAAIQSLKAKSYKYKNKYAEVVKNYKELREEKNKIENTLIENQDKGLRRIAELREQCQLEQKAKAHLEENLRLLLEEKDSRICVLETQINLLKEGGKSSSTKSLLDDCDSHYSDGGSGDARSEDSISLSNDVSVLQEKVERQQHQINQDKKTITSQRDHIALLKKQNENLSQELEEKMKYLNSLEDEKLKLKSEQEAVFKSLQDRLKELEKREEDTVMAMAETKKNMHVELELKEKQLKKADEEAKQYQAIAEREKELHSELRKQHEDKVNELMRQLELTEKTLEEEKQSLLQELGHGKTAAINLMQQECAKKISTVEKEWQTKWEALQSSCEESSQSQIEELKVSLSDTTEKLKKYELRTEDLDSLVSVLEKENASLKNSVEKLESELSQSSANFEKLKSSYSDYESLKGKENLLKIQEALNKELNDRIAKLAIVEQEMKNQHETVCDQLNEKKVLIANLENDKRDLVEKIKILELSQKDIETLCASLKNELSILEGNFNNEKSKVINFKEESIKKSEDIANLNEILNKLKTDEKLLAEKLSMSLAEIREFESENADLLLNNRLLSDEIETMKHSLHNKNKEINFLTENFSKAEKEIHGLMEALAAKEIQIKQAMFSYKQVECLANSLQEQQFSMRSTMENLRNICESTVNKSNYISEIIESFDGVQLQSIFKSLKKCSENNCICVEDVCSNSNENEGDNDSELTSKIDVSCENVNKIAKFEIKSNAETKSLFEVADSLKKENIALKEEICACKTSAEQQDVEFAKNITILQQSLSDLQEERNNLSLVLQSIERAQVDNSNKKVQNGVQIKGKTEEHDEDCIHQNCVTRISSLNSKVKSEIDALSSQTEAINKELKILHDKFISNRDSSSEKIIQLSSKLLFRTEMLINVKADLDSTIQSADSFKELLEKFQRDLDEKNKLVAELESNKKELEIKLKSLKVDYFNKECSLKETHNCQLIELKNQTELTIEKLNNQIKQLNKQLENEENEQNLKFSNAELNYQKQISELNDQFHKTLNVQKDMHEFTKICNSFETKIMDSTSKLDIYCSKIIRLNDKINMFSSKLKEKDEIILNQNNSLLDLQEKLKKYGEWQKDFNDLQNELITTSQLLLEANKTLEDEKNKLKSSELKISKLEADYSNSVKEIEKLSSDMQEKNDFQSKLNSSLEELKTLKRRQEETLAVMKTRDFEYQELQEKYSMAINEIGNLKDQKRLLKMQTLSDSEFSDKFKAVSAVVSNMNKLFDEHQSKIYEKLSNKELQLRNIESKLFVIFSKYDSKLKEVSDYVTELSTHIKDTENIKHLLEKEREKIKSLEATGLQWKSKYEKSVDDVNKLMSSKKDINQLLEKKEAELNDMKSKFVTSEKEIENLKLKIVEIPTLKDKLGKNKIELQNCLKKLSELNETITSVESERSQWKLKFEKSIHEIDVLSVSNKDGCRLLEEQEIQLNDMKSQLKSNVEEIKMLKSQINEISILQDKLNKNEEELQRSHKLLNQQTKKESVLENEKKDLESKITCAEEEIKILKLQISEISVLQDELNKSKEESQRYQKLLNEQTEKEVVLINEKEELNSKLAHAEEESERLKLEIGKISVLQGKASKDEEKLQEYQKILNEQEEKLIVLENEKHDWKSKYETECKNHEKTSSEAVKHKENVKKLVLELKTKNTKVKSLTEELEKTQKTQKLAIEKLENKIEELKLEIKSLSQSFLEKENAIVMKETEKKNLEAHHEESLKCLKDKLQNAEKNYKTQIEEMKLKINKLEKENSSLKSEKENFLIIQNQFKDLKNVEEKVQCELKSKDEQLKVLQEKLDISNKEQMEKSHTFQETMKDKENMILKMKTNIESISKDHKENVEELNKKIKHLEVEREQLMLQAQERVSATEAKCREDIKSLQEKNEKLLLENKEIENLRSQIAVLNGQLDESLLVAESNQASANKEIALLKEQLVSTEKKLTEVEKYKLLSESELTQKLERLQQENKLLLHNNDHVEKLKAEKEELNEKLKTAVQQVNKIDVLQTEREHLRKENDKLSAEIKNIRTVENEITSLKEKLESLQENENLLKKQNEELISENENLKTELLSSKDSLRIEKDGLLLEKEKLLTQIQHLESCVSDSQNVSVKDYVDSLKKEYETAIKAKDDDMLVKLKQLVRDFSIQMDVKDKDSEQMINELIEKNEFLEEKLQKEHAVEIAALRQDLFEKDCALEEMRDSYEETIQEKNAKIKEQELKIKSLSSRDNCATSDSVHGTSEHSDWDDSWVVPDEVTEHSSPNRDTCDVHVKEIESLQEELAKSNSEIKELKILLRLSPPDSMVNNNNRRDSLQSLPEPTEFEYLKNIIYEYMMGKEPVTLAKVIAAVLRFSDVQTQQVIRREEAKHPAK